MAKTTVTYYMDIDETGAVRGAGRVENSLKGVEDQAEHTSTASIALGNIMADVSQQIAAQVADLPGMLFELGTSTEETASKYQTVLGPAIQQVNGFLDQFANKAGLSHQQGEEMASTTAAMAQGMGFAQQQSASYATQALKLAGDISSFNNAAGGTKEVLEGINSAVTGEREQLKKYGIVIRETDVQQQALANTGKKNAAALTAQEKATATLQLITQRAGKAVGDLDRTQNSTQNTMRRLRAEAMDLRNGLAKRLLPAFHSLISAGLNLIHTDFFKSMISGIGDAASAIAILVANFDKIAPVVLGAAAAYGTYKAVVNAAAIAEKAAALAQKAWNVAMEANPIGLVIGLLGALVGVLATNGKAWQGFKTLIGGVWDFLIEMFMNLPQVALNSFRLLDEIMLAPFKMLWGYTKNMFSDLTSNFWHFISAIKKGITGDFSGAWSELKAIGASAGRNFVDAAGGEMAKLDGRLHDVASSANFGPAVDQMAAGGAQMGSALADMFTLTAGAGVQAGSSQIAAQAGQQLSNVSVDPQGNLTNNSGGGTAAGSAGRQSPIGSAQLQTWSNLDGAQRDVQAIQQRQKAREKELAVIDQIRGMKAQSSSQEQSLTDIATSGVQTRGKALAFTQEQWGQVAQKTGQAAEQALEYGQSVQDVIKGILSGLINQVVAMWIRNAVQTAGLSGPAALFVTPVLVAGATAAAHAVMDPLMDFEQGGLLRGPFHSQGGIPARVGNRGMVELEGDEYVMNRESTQRGLPVINAMNADPALAEQLSNSYVGRSGALTINAMPASSPIAQSQPRDIAGEVARGIRDGLKDTIVEAKVAISEVHEKLDEYEKLKQRTGN